MENTIENKGKFFAQYFGQKVLMPFEAHVGVFQSDLNYTVNFLELKSLSSITDEDAIEVAKMHRYHTDNGDSIYAKVGKEMVWRTFGLNGLPTREGFCLPFETADFLRSRGYLLPFMDLSVDDILSYKWAVIKP